MTVISHGPKEKCWNNTSHERFQASWSAMYIKNPQPGITVQKDPSPPKKKARKEKKMLQAGHDIPSFFFINWIKFELHSFGSSDQDVTKKEP